MELTPESLGALAALSKAEGADLVEDLRDMGRRVQAVVPDCVGVSLTVLAEELTFTLVSSGAEIAVMDALQYIAGGPCVDALSGSVPLETTDLDQPDRLDEKSWRLFAQASVARGIRSTLSLPVRRGGAIVGVANLYGASGQAFTGHESELAKIVGALAAEAVKNADLSFMTREYAERAPRGLEESTVVHQATGILAAQQGLDPQTARRQLVSAARRAGVSPIDLARTLVDETQR